MFQVLVSPSESTNVSYARENALISHDILSTSSLRKFVKIRWIFLTLQTARSDRNDSPITRQKIVPSIITFMLSTLALEQSILLLLYSV